MKHFEDDLKRALSRVAPPDGFAGRVLAHVAENRARAGWADRVRWWFAVPKLRWIAVAAICLVIVTGVQYEHQARRQAEGERAKREVLFALKLTARQLQFTENQIRRITNQGRDRP